MTARTRESLAGQSAPCETHQTMYDGARQARCSCGLKRPSDRSLPLFKNCDDGSDLAEVCLHCEYTKGAHKQAGKNPFICSNYERHGGWTYDTFYCGHAGTPD